MAQAGQVPRGDGDGANANGRRFGNASASVESSGQARGDFLNAILNRAFCGLFKRAGEEVMVTVANGVEREPTNPF